MKTKLFTLFLALTASVGTVFADRAKIGDLYYDLNATNKTAEVICEHLQEFNNYSGLITADIPESVTYNGQNYSVTSIGYEAFWGCGSLTSVTIGNNITSIGYEAFWGCGNLTSVTIGSSVTFIDSYAFAGCNSLPIIDNLRYADTYLVEVVNNSLSSYTIKEGTKFIGSTVFSNCSSLASITIPSSVTSIGEEAFYGCSGLTSITIPNGVTSVGRSAFKNCSRLVSVVWNAMKCEIESNSFPECVTSFIIGDDVEEIPYGLCGGLSQIISVIIPNSVTNIGDYAFYKCNSLASATIGNNVTHIGNSAFWICSSLTSITIGNSVTSIGDNAFDECTHLTSVVIPNSVTSIGKSAFARCGNLSSVTIGNNVTSIGEGAFNRCSSLTSVIIPNSVTNIGSSAFSGCNGLVSVTIGNGITSINGATFDGCSSLTSVVIPNNVTSIGGSAFYGCTSLTSVTIPNSVTSIEGGAFYGCTGLASVAIPKNVTSIERNIFRNCSNLETVYLGNAVETIGTAAFSGCQRLIDIYCYTERVPDVVKDAFDGVSRKAYLWVPANRLRNYQTHEIWGEFDVKAMAAEGVNASSVTIVPDYNTASVIWPAVENADTYELAITDKDGKTICTLVFNGDGILQSIAFSAPSRNNSSEQTQSTGFRFEVSGLEEGTSYNYSIVAKDVTSKALQTFNGSFKTLGGVDALTDISTDKTSLRKELINGQLFIHRGDKTYTVQGQQIR